MKRIEAENLIGSLIITGFIKGGVYIGELLEIIPSKPFRVNVKIKGIYKYPSLYNHNTRPLTFINKDITVIKENEIVNTGNSIEIFEGILLSYNDSLKNSLLKYLLSVNNCLDRYRANNGNYHSYYIGSIDDCIKLKNDLKRRIKNIKC